MTVSTSKVEVTKAFNGATTAFPLGGDFQFLGGADLDVYFVAASGAETLKALGDDYTVSGDGRTGNGTLNVSLAKQAGFISARIERVTDLAQEVAYTPNAAPSAFLQEKQLDRLTMAQQEQRNRLEALIERALRFPRGETADELPPAAGRAGRIQAYDQGGAPDLSLTVAGIIAQAIAAAEEIVNNAVLSVAQANAQYIKTIGLLRGIANPAHGDIAILTQTWLRGTFEFRTGNQAAAVVADPYEGLTVPPAFDLSGASGAWFRIVENETYHANWWGAVAVNGATWHSRVHLALSIVPEGSLFWLAREKVQVVGGVQLAKKGVQILGYGDESEIDASAAPTQVNLFQLARSGCAIRGVHAKTKENNTTAGNTAACILGHEATGNLSPDPVTDLVAEGCKFTGSIGLVSIGDVVGAGVSYSPVKGVKVIRCKLYGNVQPISMFAVDDWEVTGCWLEFHNDANIYSNNFTFGARILGCRNFNFHDNDLVGALTSDAVDGHAAFCLGAAVVDGNYPVTTRRQNFNGKIHDNRIRGFKCGVIGYEARGSVEFANNHFLEDPTKTIKRVAVLTTSGETISSSGVNSAIEGLLFRNNVFRGYSTLWYGYGGTRHIHFGVNILTHNSRAGDGNLFTSLAYGQFGGIGLTEFIGNILYSQPGLFFRFTTAVASEVVRIQRNYWGESGAPAVPYAANAGVGFGGPGQLVCPANENFPHYTGEWARQAVA